VPSSRVAAALLHLRGAAVTIVDCPSTQSRPAAGVPITSRKRHSVTA
jgi:hypothetical protein